MVEYIARCPKCQKHNIMETAKQIKANNKRFPQKIIKCNNCKKPTRQTIIGEIDRVPDYSITSMPEYATHNRILIRYWKID